MLSVYPFFGALWTNRLVLEISRVFESLGFFVETSKSRPTHARLRNRELADEAELVSLSVG